MICRLQSGAGVPSWLAGDELGAYIQTPEEVTIIAREGEVPPGVPVERGWRAIKVLGPLEFTLVGVLVSLLNPLAGAGVSVFALSTYDTDYVLVRSTALEQALAALRAAGHNIIQ